MNNYNTRIQRYIEEYRKRVGNRPVDCHEIADWLISEKLWQPSPKDARNLLSRDISQAMRTQYTLDSHGRKVRRKHAVRVKETNDEGELKQMVLWSDVEFATPDFMQQSFQQRRSGLADGCWQLTKDLEYYNSTFNKAEPIEMLLDFRDDIDEKRASDGDDTFDDIF